ncbi:aminoglycoside phosphotransferase family protein [Micromonospora chaiyaphumensis]|uniref:Predicted kinase, aminoglycoside phosphotransferase (APT) family n=1 Tax=Micromonospora chaiyaphumensis TaxID=307119 RepID=A0A1C4ZJ85_9ACTN|nr:aminoglycoside phosphotransferase family protein [Micromonospora chaiyaphumensis]SCF33120.1 Predicted kinase, aminoglycoside phosphotransferase (APT) family [Micromonospora chaiyaphumensis]
MHRDEVRTDATLVRRLVGGQFPQWADRPVTPVPSGGTSNAIYRLGDDLAIRLPRIADAVEQVTFEHEWLPVLASSLPVAVPQPCAVGRPAEGYPWPWAIHRWVDGVHPTEGNVDPRRFAANLGAVVAGLQRADTAGGRAGYRSGPLSGRDGYLREWTEAARGVVDTDAVLAIWEDALAAPAWAGPPVWTHGDLLAGNVLVRDGRLCALIDFGAAGVGDPACDAMAAWALLDSDSREVFRETAGFDDAAWARGKGWALTFITALTYYRETNPTMYALAQRAVGAVLSDHA